MRLIYTRIILFVSLSISLARPQEPFSNCKSQTAMIDHVPVLSTIDTAIYCIWLHTTLSI